MFIWSPCTLPIIDDADHAVSAGEQRGHIGSLDQTRIHNSDFAGVFTVPYPFSSLLWKYIKLVRGQQKIIKEGVGKNVTLKIGKG